MECVFRGLDTKRCFSQQKCAGIENLILQMGGSREFALGFARYAFRTSLLNKIKDNKFESLYNYSVREYTVKNKIKYLIYELADKIFSRFIGNPYSIQERFVNIENRIFTMEFSPKRYSPIEYCKHAGSGYGFFFYWAAIGSGKSRKFAKLMYNYGTKLGTIVTLRDMVKDYQSDLKFGKFNPFHHMEFDKIEPYFLENVHILQNDIQAAKQRLSGEISIMIPKHNAFDAVFRYTMQSEKFCAKCSREAIISQLNTPAAKTATGVLASLVVMLGINSACTTVSAAGGGGIAAILQESSDTCCNRCCTRCCGATLESCCDSITSQCCDNCRCGSEDCCDCSGCDCSGCTCNC